MRACCCYECASDICSTGSCVSVTLSGITVCTDCYDDGGTGKKWTVTNLNRTYTLPWVSGGTSSVYSENFSTVTRYSHTDATCATLSSTSTGNDLNVSVTVECATCAGVAVTQVVVTHFDNVSVRFFSGVVTGIKGGCGSATTYGDTISNAYTACSLSPAVNYGHSGTAVVQRLSPLP